jgi:hypothetical protein
MKKFPRLVIRMNASEHSITDKLFGETVDLSKHSREQLGNVAHAVCLIRNNRTIGLG